MVGELRTEIKVHRPVNSLLKAIHDAVRGLRREINLSGDSPWSRQLTAIRTEVSNLLRAEIETAPARVRRLLRPRQAQRNRPHARSGSTRRQRGRHLVEFVGACRNYASELAINEVATRTRSELEIYLESGTKVLIEALRHATHADRAFRQSQVDAAISCAGSTFGAEYAGFWPRPRKSRCARGGRAQIGPR